MRNYYFYFISLYLPVGIYYLDLSPFVSSQTRLKRKEDLKPLYDPDLPRMPPQFIFRREIKTTVHIELSYFVEYFYLIFSLC